MICAAVEYRGGTENAAFNEIEEQIHRNTRDVLLAAAESGAPPRTAADALAEARVRRAMTYRRWV